MEKEIAQLRAPGLPKVLRGLPRLYSLQDRKISKIKSPFNNFHLIKSRYLEKLSLPLYQLPSLPATTRITLFTWVMEDGWGDYYTQLDAAELLSKAFPNITISLITLLHNNQPLHEPASPFDQHVLYYTGKRRGEIIYEEPSESLYALLRKTSLLLQLPTYFPHTEEFLKKVGVPIPHQQMGEYGLIDTKWFHPGTGTHCMGLHFLEKGILIKKIPDTPIQKGFYLDYTKTARGHYLFFHILLKALASDPDDCALATTCLNLFLQELEVRVKPLCLEYGVREIKIVLRGNLCVIPIQQVGKVVTISYLDKVPHSDFLKLVAQTDLFMGCTGDGSITEAISAKKAFFYDAPPHKRNFLRDLIALAEDRLQNYPETVKFLQISLCNPHLILEDVQGGWVSEEFLWVENEKTSPEDTRDEAIAEMLGALLQTPRTQEGFRLLCEIIQAEYSVNNTLCAVVAQEVVRSSLSR